MKTYVFRYKTAKAWFWKSEKNVIGHKMFHDQNKMVLYYEDGGVREISGWSDKEVKLGSDWVLSVQNNMKKESGQDVSLSVGG